MRVAVKQRGENNASEMREREGGREGGREVGMCTGETERERAAGHTKAEESCLTKRCSFACLCLP